MAKAELQWCVECEKEKPLSEFYISRKRDRKVTKVCKECGDTARSSSGKDPLGRNVLVPSLIALYEELLPLMENIRKATFEELVRSEWDEEAMRLVMRGLIERAARGDANAAKLIIDVRLKLRAEGDGSEEDVINLAQLLASDPLADDQSTS